jgi:hypothetical protein
MIEAFFVPARACQGVLFDSLSNAVHLLSKTAGSTGLRVTVWVLEKLAEIDRKASNVFKANIPIEFDNTLPHDNDWLVPQLQDYLNRCLLPASPCRGIGNRKEWLFDDSHHAAHNISCGHCNRSLPDDQPADTHPSEILTPGNAHDNGSHCGRNRRSS